MSATIKDVAKLAQVSVATVSRSMNNSAQVSPVKRRRINQAIKKLNYKPNIIAQSLVSKRLNNIGLVPSRTPSQIMVSPYISRMLVGFGRSFTEKGYEPLMVLAESEEKQIEKCVSLIDAGTVQGFVLLNARVYDKTINKLAELGFPFVVIGRPHPASIPENSQINSVDTDNVNDITESVNYLISMGHTRIALMHSPLGFMVNQDRYDGYILALQNAGIEIDDDIIIDAGYSIEEALEASQKLLKIKKRPTAVCTTDDLKATAFIKVATQAGLNVPGDISVMGHNNYSESKICTPSLTTVNVPIEELAYTSGSLLCEIIENPDLNAKRILLPTEIVMRDSVAKNKK